MKHEPHPPIGAHQACALEIETIDDAIMALHCLHADIRFEEYRLCLSVRVYRGSFPDTIMVETEIAGRGPRYSLFRAAKALRDKVLAERDGYIP